MTHSKSWAISEDLGSFLCSYSTLTQYVIRSLIAFLYHFWWLHGMLADVWWLVWSIGKFSASKLDLVCNCLLLQCVSDKVTPLWFITANCLYSMIGLFWWPDCCCCWCCWVRCRLGRAKKVFLQTRSSAIDSDIGTCSVPFVLSPAWFSIYIIQINNWYIFSLSVSSLGYIPRW